MNTVWFMLAATVLNIVLMMVLFIICFVLITRFVDPNSYNRKRKPKRRED
jgi:uncharacterized membrane protein